VKGCAGNSLLKPTGRRRGMVDPLALLFAVSAVCLLVIYLSQ
jgi:hypothetical protein